MSKLRSITAEKKRKYKKKINRKNKGCKMWKGGEE